MSKFELTYDDEEGLFPIEYVLTGSYEWQPPEPDVGIMSGGFSDICIESVRVKIGDTKLVPCYGFDNLALRDAFNKKAETSKEFAAWLEEGINKLARADAER